MPRRKGLSVHDVLTILENDKDFWDANIYVCPPNDPNCSDADSGDEECGTIDNLSRHQLEAEGEATLRTGPYERERIGETEESVLDQSSARLPNGNSTRDDGTVLPVDQPPLATAHQTKDRKRRHKANTPAESTAEQSVLDQSSEQLPMNQGCVTMELLFQQTCLHRQQLNGREDRRLTCQRRQLNQQQFTMSLKLL